MYHLRSLILTLAAVAAGCGGNGVAEPPPAPAQQQPAPAPEQPAPTAAMTEKTPQVPAQANLPTASGKELATFGAGCFWCVEAVLEQLPGVLDVTSGYMGGHVENPTYKQVCTGETGHAEVVQVTFDPGKLSYATLLD